MMDEGPAALQACEGSPRNCCFCVCGPTSNLQAGTRAARPKQPLHASSSSQKGGRFDVLGLLQQGEEVGTYVTYVACCSNEPVLKLRWMLLYEATLPLTMRGAPVLGCC
jgi:hypothetical protein